MTTPDDGLVATESELLALEDDPEERLPVWIRAVGHGMAVAAGFALVLLMMLTVADVFRRQFLGRGVPYTIETTELALVAVVFGSLMSAEVNKTHVRTTILTSRVSLIQARRIRLLGMVIATLFAGWMAYATWRTGIASFEIREYRAGLGRVPIWPAKVMIPIGLTGLTLVCAARCVVLARLVFKRNDPSEDVGRGATR